MFVDSLCIQSVVILIAIIFMSFCLRLQRYNISKAKSRLVMGDA